MHGDDFSRAIRRLGGVANILGKEFATNTTKNGTILRLDIVHQRYYLQPYGQLH
jgi:hypothetical protein